MSEMEREKKNRLPIIPTNIPPLPLPTQNPVAE
jgi:hypothetical protein